MNGREKLEPMSDLFLDMGVDVEGNRNYQPWTAYDKDEADKVMDDLEAQVKNLEKANAELIKRVQELEDENNKLEAENERLKGEIKVLHTECDTCWKVEELRKENAKLKCLSLHLFKNLSYYEYKDWGRVRDYLPESKMKERSVRNADRWCRIKERCYEAYRKAKKALREGK